MIVLTCDCSWVIEGTSEYRRKKLRRETLSRAAFEGQTDGAGIANEM